MFVDARDIDIQPNRDPGFDLNPSLTMNDGWGIAIVSDALERNIAKPARSLACDIRQPEPVGLSVPINVSVWLPNVSSGNDRIVPSAPMGAAMLPERASKLR